MDGQRWWINPTAQEASGFSSNSLVGSSGYSSGDVATNMFTAALIRDMSKSEKKQATNGWNRHYPVLTNYFTFHLY